MNVHDAGWRSLANAIVECAARDLELSLKYCKKRKNREEIIGEKEEYRFFHSEYFRMLTDLDGPMIAKKLRERVWGDG